MPNDWNPNAPVALGLEWFATQMVEEVVLATSGPPFWQRLRSTSAETITALRMHCNGNPQTTSPLFSVVEIMEAGDENPSGHATAQYPPNADGTFSGAEWVKDPGAVTTDLYQAIDDPVVNPPQDAEHIRTTTMASGSVTYRCHVASSAFPSNARVLRLRIRAVHSAVGPDPTVATQITYRIEHAVGGLFTPVGAFQFSVHSLGGQLVEVDLGEINPHTLLPWTPADVQEFDGGDWVIRISGTTTNNGNSRTALHCMALEVDYVPVENRVAVATWQRPPGAVAGQIETDDLVSMPSGSAGWSKASGVDYTFVWRRAFAHMVAGPGMANDVRWLGLQQDLGALGNPPGPQFPPVPGMIGDRIAVDAFGLPVRDFEGTFPRAMCLILIDDNGDPSDDSQGYFVAGIGEVALIHATSTIAQRITPAQNASYLGVRAIVAPPLAGGAPLTISVHRVSDGVQVGGSITWTPDEVRSMPPVPQSTLRYLAGLLDSPAALQASTQYEVRLTSASPTPGWSVLTPRTIGAEATTFGGSTDSLRVEASVQTDRDISVTLMIQPDPPQNPKVETSTIPTGDVAGTCSTAEIQHLLVTWDKPAVSLGGSFARYEIERLEDDTAATWEPLHQITDEDTTSFLDRTARRGVPARYRVRVIATTAAFSDWAETGWATANATGAEIIFTSNADPTLECIYDREPRVDYQFLDHAADEVIPIAGADYQVAFFEAEDRGVGARTTIVANFGRQPRDELGRPRGGRAVFEPLRRISRATGIPYVVVLDHEGNRWYGHITLDRGVNEEPGWRYYLDVQITPVATVPTVTVQEA